MWTSTQNDILKDKMSAVVAVLSACQQKIGTGYLSAFPSEFFDRFEAVKQVWAPYYTIHKVQSKVEFNYASAFGLNTLDFKIFISDRYWLACWINILLLETLKL